MTNRVYADLNKPGGGAVVWLTPSGTLRDLDRFGIELAEGLRLDFCMGDADADGRPDDLYFSGVVGWDDDRRIWMATIDPTSYAHASEVNG